MTKQVTSGWQSIETASPEVGTDMLVYGNGFFNVASVGWIDDYGPVWFNGDVVVYPTHWMPLPDPPDDGEEK
jgi:hypothetical protein